ncbi:MAG: hypothetical protein SGCHY_003648 [Lobulomycetales sp.]
MSFSFPPRQLFIDTNKLSPTTAGPLSSSLEKALSEVNSAYLPILAEEARKGEPNSVLLTEAISRHMRATSANCESPLESPLELPFTETRPEKSSSLGDYPHMNYQQVRIPGKSLSLNSVPEGTELSAMTMSLDSILPPSPLAPFLIKEQQSAWTWRQPSSPTGSDCSFHGLPSPDTDFGIHSVLERVKQRETVPGEPLYKLMHEAQVDENGGNVFVCACQKRFAKKCGLKSHAKAHEKSGETLGRSQVTGKVCWYLDGVEQESCPESTRTHMCTHCERAYTRRHDLRRHLRSHTDVRLVCQKCGRGYKRSDALFRHSKRCKAQDEDEDDEEETPDLERFKKL